MSNKILDDMRDVMRRRHYSIRTERSYCGWVKRFILHFNIKSRDDLSEGEKKIETYLTFLARDRNVAPSTQNQALNALVFLYKHILKQPLNEKINAERAAKKVKIPVVLTRDETKRIILALTGIHQLVVKLLYGFGWIPVPSTRPLPMLCGPPVFRSRSVRTRFAIRSRRICSGEAQTSVRSRVCWVTKMCRRQ